MKIIVVLFALQLADTLVLAKNLEYYQDQKLLCDGQNEEYREVVSACPPTCSHPVGPLCMALIRKPSCVCALGTVRDTHTNRCVRKEECPQNSTKPITFEEKKLLCSGQHEKYQDWISACPDICPKVSSPPQPMKCLAIIEKPSCVCTDGTIRDTVNNKCVPREECPKVAQPVMFDEKPKIVCNALNEEYREWVSACPSHCPKPGSVPFPEKCMAIVNKPSCVCTLGTIRDTINNKCVKPEECPKIEANTLFEEKPKLVCGQNEEYREWRSACPSHCQTTGIERLTTMPAPPSKCHAIINEPSCVCTAGTIRDNINKKCVKPQDCPKIPYPEAIDLKCDGENERLSPITTCQSNCQGIKCDMLMKHEPSCVCAPGTLRDLVTGKCLHFKDCPKRIVD